MIKGRYVTQGGVMRPIVNATLAFSGAPSKLFFAQFIVDTGADSTLLGTVEVAHVQRSHGIDPFKLPQGQSSSGVGGEMRTRIIPNVTLDLLFKTLLIHGNLTIVEPNPDPTIPPVPSLLGRDVMQRFLLICDQQSNKVRLLDRGEANLLLYNGKPIP